MTDKKSTIPSGKNPLPVPVNLDCREWYAVHVTARRKERLASRSYREKKVSSLRAAACVYRSRAKRAEQRARKLYDVSREYDLRADALADVNAELKGLI